MNTNTSSCLYFANIRGIDINCHAKWDFLLSTVTNSEKEKVLRYRLSDDKIRSLLSLLLQKTLIRNHQCLSDNNWIEIKRTKEVLIMFE
jgi:hypothetical protein